MSHLILLDEELCGKLTKLSEFEKSGSVLVDLFNDLFQSHRLDLKTKSNVFEHVRKLAYNENICDLDKLK